MSAERALGIGRGKGRVAGSRLPYGAYLSGHHLLLVSSAEHFLVGYLKRKVVVKGKERRIGFTHSTNNIA